MVNRLLQRLRRPEQPTLQRLADHVLYALDVMGGTTWAAAPTSSAFQRMGEREVQRLQHRQPVHKVNTGQTADQARQEQSRSAPT